VASTEEEAAAGHAVQQNYQHSNNDTNNGVGSTGFINENGMYVECDPLKLSCPGNVSFATLSLPAEGGLAGQLQLSSTSSPFRSGCASGATSGCASPLLATTLAGVDVTASANTGAGASASAIASASGGTFQSATGYDKQGRNTRLAIKIIDKTQLTSIEAALRVEREIAALTILSPHPNIVRFEKGAYSAYTDSGVFMALWLS